MKQLSILLFLFYSSFALSSGQWTWGDYVIKSVINKQPRKLAHFFERTDALQLPWKYDEQEFGVNGNEIPPHAIDRKSFACKKSARLWPTHPQQSTKSYHFAVYANYNAKKNLDPTNGAVCARPNFKHKPTKCLFGAIAKVVIMSDLYQDECGNVYRGFWPVLYTVGNKYYQTGTENMGTLSSKGRWFSVDNSGDNFKLAATYSLKKSDFLFLAHPSRQDEVKIQQERQRALRVVKKKGFQYLDQK